MGRRRRKRAREGEGFQGELLGESGATTADEAEPPPETIEVMLEATTLHTSASQATPLETSTSALATIALAAPPSLSTVTVEAVSGEQTNPSSTVERGEPPLHAPPVVQLPVPVPTLQIVSVTAADTTPAPAATSTSPPPATIAHHPPPVLTLEPPPSRTPVPRGVRRAKRQPRATRETGSEPSGGGYATDSGAVPRGDTASGARAEDGSSRDSATARARPAGEPLARARALVEQRKIQEAIELYLGILTVNPSNLKARNNLGVLFDELKQFEAARDHLEAAARLEPENVEVLTNLASTLTSLARYDEAEAILRRAQKVDADDPRVLTSIGVLHFRRGRYDQAEMELRSVCARDSGNGTACYYRGEALHRLGRYDEAFEALVRAAELMPNDPKPVYTLGHLYDRKHLPEEAAEMYRRARRLQKR